MMVVTIQPFLNELDAMEIKMEELRDVVSTHVIVESKRTYTGRDKPLIFAQHEDRFQQFNHVCLEYDGPWCNSPWEAERLTSEFMARVVVNLAPDVVLYLDADEIPSRDCIQRFMEAEHQTMLLEMDHCQFYANRAFPTKWYGPKIHRYEKGGKQPYRCHTNYPVLQDAGWQFQNVGTREELLLKLNGFSHANDAGGIDFRNRVQRGELPGFERTQELTRLPECCTPERFPHLFHATHPDCLHPAV